MWEILEAKQDTMSFGVCRQQGAGGRDRGRGDRGAGHVLETWRQAGRASRGLCQPVGSGHHLRGKDEPLEGLWGCHGGTCASGKAGGPETRKSLPGSSRTGAGGWSQADAGTWRWAAGSKRYVRQGAISPATASQGASFWRGQGLPVSGHCGNSCPPSPDARPESALLETLAGCSLGGGGTLGCGSGQEPRRRTAA